MDEVGDEVGRVRQEEEPERKRRQKPHEGRSPAVPVVHDEREHEGHPGEDEVPEQEPEVDCRVVTFANELEPGAAERRGREADDDDVAFLAEPARAEGHSIKPSPGCEECGHRSGHRIRDPTDGVRSHARQVWDVAFRTIIEPFRIHSVEPLRMTTEEQRREALEARGLQPVRPARGRRADRPAHRLRARARCRATSGRRSSTATRATRARPPGSCSSTRCRSSSRSST